MRRAGVSFLIEVDELVHVCGDGSRKAPKHQGFV